LLELMVSNHASLQHNAAFALYGLADNEDNIAAIVREGGVQALQACEQHVQVYPPPPPPWGCNVIVYMKDGCPAGVRAVCPEIFSSGPC